jgi:uncharacterized ferritin-like protein (DUF455 family)
MSKHLLQHGIQLVLHSVGHVELGVIIQQDDAAYKFVHSLKATEWQVIFILLNH